jgi:hypothetical protein
MNKRISFRIILTLPVLVWFCGAQAANADTSHARIVRVSVVQGDVRFAQDVKGDPLTASNVAWEKAELNLPIRQGYVLATDNGKAGVEFENGAMAFLSNNTVLEFYDLSLQDGARTTRLILRQGSAEFYVNPSRGEYFSVTGGDFSVQAEGKTTFRLDNFDDGSDVHVMLGHVAVLTKDKTTPLGKGQSLSMQAGQADSETVSAFAGKDDFDTWVSGQLQTEQAAANASLQYANAYGYGYMPGFGDLYTYGAWYPIAGYGYCWQPFGMGFGWDPFGFGSWYFDPFWGWTFIGNQPWGWLPYHYGGWIFAPGYGWMWNPGVITRGRGGPPRVWRPATAVFVRSGGTTGVVPLHPMDRNGKTPLNLARGVFPVTAGTVSNQLIATTGEKWKVDRKPGRDLVTSQLRAAAPPGQVFRSMSSSGIARASGGGTAVRASGLRSASEIGTRAGSTITFDPAQHRFVNSELLTRRSGEVSNTPPEMNGRVLNGARQGVNPAGVPSSTSVMRGRESTGTVPAPMRVTPPPRPAMTPPPVPRSTIIMRSGGSSSWGGSSRGSSGASFPRSAPSAPAPAPASAPRAPSGRPH